MTRVVVWIAEGTWQGCVDAAVRLAPDNSEFTLLHVSDGGPAEVLHGAFDGLLGRGGGHDPGSTVEGSSEDAARELVTAAAGRLGSAATVDLRSGDVEREVVGACADADLLVCARDGAHDRLGPRSLGRCTRFVVDHAPCAVLLVWPDETPGVATIPPKP